MIIAICLLIGFLAAFIGSIVGLGGGIILVPSLLLLNQISDSFGWATSNSIVAISLFVMVFTALSSSITYAKKKRIDFISGFILIIGSIPGGLFGSWLNQFIETDTFSIYFGLFMLVMFFVFFIPIHGRESSSFQKRKGFVNRTVVINNSTHTYSISIVGSLVIAWFIGTLSGLFGIGGGSLMVPAMILLFRMPAHIATATSMFMILFLSLSSSIAHISLGHVAWEYIWLFVPGAWIGGTIGAKVNQRLNSKSVVWMLRILLIFIGIRLIWQGL